MRLIRILCTTFALLGVCCPQTAYSESADVDYLTQVKTLLRERCFACHGALKQEGGLRLDTAEFIKQGGDSGPAIIPGTPATESLLIERVAEPDPALRMPPEFEGEPFSSEQIEILQDWITTGAAAPADEEPEQDPSQHWAFQPVERPVVPEVKNAGWVRNPIDAWIAAGQESQGLQPQGEASRIQLLRRLSFDLTGLPPTAEEIAECLNDSSPDWYERAVERLLADPRHGERWARHWMDIWRYSDWWGFRNQLRNSQPHMWHWRDWIVESLNRDAPYDEMLRLMLAADELAPGDPDKLRATAFLARNYYIFNRTRWMDETVEHVGKGLLGLTTNCAKCHDHKFDPITHVDYYKMRAFFESYLVRMDMVPGEPKFENDGIPRVFDGLPEEPTYLHIRGDEAQPDESEVIKPGVPALLEFAPLEVEEVALPEVAAEPARQPWVLENHIAAAEQKVAAALTKQKAAEARLEKVENEAAPDGDEMTPEETPSFAPIHETFATLDETRWKLGPGDWSHSPGQVQQSLDGPQRSILQLLQNAPRDFEATLRFTIQGGSRYRSVGIAFDGPSAADGQTVDPKFLVYASAHAPGQKVQASYDDNGTWRYPGDGKKAVELELNTGYTLRLQVRGPLMNVFLDEEPTVIWQSPVPRTPGAMQLITFDALATIQEFHLTALPADVTLRTPGSAATGATDELAEARRDLKLATANTEVAQAELSSVLARAEAMRASWEKPGSEQARQLRIEAIRSEQRMAVNKANVELLNAAFALERATKDKRKAAEEKHRKAEEALAKAQKTLEQEVAEDATFTRLPGAKWSATRFQYTGKDDPEIAFPETSTGRRTALAKWVTDRRNPLTARVAVNHLWTRHFGQPLVATTFDFGRNGATPTHPELLDWLASELMDNGWSMKHIHRLIVTSSTYRMASTTTGAEQKLAKDPDNQYWWRRVPIRLESQAVRDSVLALAGTLDETMGGPSVAPNEQDKSRRRSLYFYHSNNDRNLLLTTFDEASVTECYRREQSVVPQQALALSNSELVLESSGVIAAALTKTHADEEEFIRQAFLQVLAIDATETEIAACQSAMSAWRELPDATDDSARANLIWTLINHNDFVTLR
ncbi:DUF1553 domain-containing protein [Rubinisphaera margarita]|uniref:DUF1553 domain-containing protein n=1 Tax=Rubinisphaera margarita TaxID=2909586 RepID=UPI001EE8D187|nr:DUF1553 domain-containing protein [Rubinisphaera margarita]MCG6158191.1 DUF1553 domain-containing protein [Rubinisphaera margarita]